MAKHAAEDVTQTPVKKTRMFKGLVITMVVLLMLSGTVASALGLFMWKYDYDYDKEFREKTNEQLGISAEAAELPKEITNIALFGVDSRSGSYSGNTDSIMIISIDEVHNKVKITSIMRDTLVYLDGRGYAKINSAYGRGGPELALKTINTHFGLNIRHYATVNFSGMVHIVNAIGGVEVSITEAERIEANKLILSPDTRIGTEKDLIRRSGKQVLTGVQAVSWSRIRSVSTAEGGSNDFGRTDRQRVVMEALFDRVMNMGMSKFPALAEALLPYVRTSLSYGDIVDMAGGVLGGFTFEQTRVPLLSYVINGDYREQTNSSTVYYNFEYATKVLRAFIYDDVNPEEYIAKHGVNKTPLLPKDHVYR